MLILLLLTLTHQCTLTPKSTNTYLMTCNATAHNMQLLDHQGNIIHKLKQQCHDTQCQAEYHIGHVRTHQLIAMVNDTVTPVELPSYGNQYWIFNSLYFHTYRPYLTNSNITTVNTTGHIDSDIHLANQILRLNNTSYTLSEGSKFQMGQHSIQLGEGFLRISSGVMSYYQHGYSYILNSSQQPLGTINKHYQVLLGYHSNSIIMTHGYSIVQHLDYQSMDQFNMVIIKPMDIKSLKLFDIQYVYLVEEQPITMSYLIVLTTVCRCHVRTVFLKRQQLNIYHESQLRERYIVDPYGGGLSIVYYNVMMRTTKDKMVTRMMPYDQQRIMIKVGNDDEQDIEDKTPHVAGIDIPLGSVIQSRKYRPYVVSNVTLVRDIRVEEILVKMFVEPSSIWEMMVLLLLVVEVGLMIRFSYLIMNKRQFIALESDII